MFIPFVIFLGFAANFYGNYRYVRGTLRGTTKPNRVSYILYAVAPLIAFAASVYQGATWAAIPTLVMALWSFVILAASFHNPLAYWRLGVFDWLCGALSVLALILWGITNNANVAILFAILSDMAATLPTLKKSWTHPETETAASYGGGAFNALTSFFAAKMWNFSELGFATYYFLSCLLLFLVIVWRRRSRQTKLNPDKPLERCKGR